LKTISIFMTVLGIAAIAATALFDLNLTVALVGMMLIVAGVVKIVIVSLWHGIAGFGAPLTAEAPPAPRKERRP
jgi:hypothetical protein